MHFILLFHFVLATANLSSRTACKSPITNKGKSFMVVFPRVWRGSSLTYYKLYISAEKETTIHIRSQDINGNRTMQGGTIVSYDIANDILPHAPRNGSVRTSLDVWYTKVLHVDADNDIAVYVIGSAGLTATAGSYIVYPTEAFSNHFVAASYKPLGAYPYNQLVILAREDNTDGNMVIGSFSFLYTSGTINGYSDADISGIEVNTTKPVSVLMSSECVDIPPGFNGCDQVVTTALPVAGWGTRYIVPPLYPRQGYLVKIFSHLPANVSVFNSTSSTVKQLRENGFLELLLETEPLTIISTSPVMVIHYGLSYDFDHVNGDAFMTTVPSLDNFANNYIFPSPSYLDNVHYINTLAITIRKDEVTGLRLNGLPIQNKLTFAVHHPLDDYVVIAVNLTGNSQTLKHVNASVFFAGLVYGRGLYLGFGFPIGLTVLPKGDGTCGGSCDDVHHSACVDLLLTKPDMCSDVTMADIYCRKTCGKCAPENGTQSCDDLHHNACANLRVNKPDMCNDSAIANVYCRKTCGKCALTCYHCNLVEDPATCNTTSQCQDGELCISTKVLETDFKLHNRLGCTSQQVCDDITEPIIGKRSEKRSYETKCCKTNLCNRN